MPRQEQSPQILRTAEVERKLRTYVRPQLVVYGPVAGLTGGMSNKAFPDNTGMTMMNP